MNDCQFFAFRSSVNYLDLDLAVDMHTHMHCRMMKAWKSPCKYSFAEAFVANSHIDSKEEDETQN